MLAANGISSNNGVHAQLYAPCPSDYETAPIDVTPTAPRPGWKDAFPQYTHNLSWVDSEGCSHSMTLRSDSLSDLMNDLRLLKSMIRQAKGKARESAPQQAAPEPDSDVPPCPIHGASMERRTSKRTGGIYFSHRMPGTKELCFGREPKR
jgi:hypothetical protein